MGGLGLCGLDTGRKRVRGEGVLGGGAREKPLLEKFKWGTSGLGGGQGVEEGTHLPPVCNLKGTLEFCLQCPWVQG